MAGGTPYGIPTFSGTTNNLGMRDAQGNVVDSLVPTDGAGNIVASILLLTNTASGLATSVLQQGQPGYLTDKGVLLVGDGQTVGGSFGGWGTVNGITGAAGSTITSANAALVGYVQNALFLEQFPGNVAHQGNGRGAGAVDLQVSRTLATEVAYGANSFAAGLRNTVGGQLATGLGFRNTVLGFAAFSVGGQQNNAYGLHAVVGGLQSTAAGNYSQAVGRQCITGNAATNAVTISGSVLTTTGDATGSYAVGDNILVFAMTGGTAGTLLQQAEIISAVSYDGSHTAITCGTDTFSDRTAGRVANNSAGQYARAGGWLGTAAKQLSDVWGFGDGITQRSYVPMKVTTADATPTEMTRDGQTYNGLTPEGSSNRYVVPAGKGYTCVLEVSGKQASSANTYMHMLAFTVANVSGTVTVSNSGTAQTLMTAINPGAWGGVSTTIGVSGTAITFSVTGAAGTNIVWAAELRAIEVAN